MSRMINGYTIRSAKNKILIEFPSTSGALYAGVVYFLILSSSIPISSGLSKRLWLVEVLPKSHNFHKPSDPNKRFSAFKSLHDATHNDKQISQSEKIKFKSDQKSKTII